ncbi:hypothetical protein SPRG_11582 [Saprolegnia parasitica CBS 223.65]|uniref:Uncharacterized protein n=1 Tax=Saprolegnia parasitica (strain CBS 223.65) TaxID=695850 RepID=A0A067BX33_SAPPC|nr:hypothetical protein SPRG_11582 [Saprolegnia parasitica CBS 223.65]KDO22823.1 hypothetical protein SPRG_11582 [Saprolegnia parasitica CBS 223.65]|eukprot:XP_012206494.1 hypothetical protein SPRG_11582 [Saprolegnia parasitica CBS 223.65]
MPGPVLSVPAPSKRTALEVQLPCAPSSSPPTTAPPIVAWVPPQGPYAPPESFLANMRAFGWLPVHLSTPLSAGAHVPPAHSFLQTEAGRPISKSTHPHAR